MAYPDPRVDAFTIETGIERGLTLGQMRGPAFDAPFHGVRERVGQLQPLTESDRRLAQYAPHLWLLRLMAERYAPRLQPGQFFSGETALGLVGSPTPGGWKPVLHVSAYRPSNGPCARGVVGHRLQTRTPAFRPVRGLPVEAPSRAWVQASAAWAHDDLVASADHLVLPRGALASLDELRSEARRMRGRVLDGVLADVRVGAESFRETQLRLACQRAGLPEPVLNGELRGSAGELLARVDQLYPEFAVAAEYDGRQHALDERQFARDADRWDAIRAAGWDHVRILRHHLVPDPSIAVARIATALARSGWRA